MNRAVGFLSVLFLASLAYGGTETVTLVNILDSNSDMGIIQRSDGELWLIEKGVGATSFWRYEGKRVSIDSPGLFCGVGSRLVLPDDGQEARIWNAVEIGAGGNIEFVTLIKVMENDSNKGIIERANGERWLIEKGVGAISFWRYAGKEVLIYSPGLFCGVGSKVILPDDGQAARIWSAERVALPPSGASPNTLGSGDSQLSDGSYYDRYYREFSVGDQVQIRLASSAFNAFLMVQDPDGQTTRTDDGGGGTDAYMSFTVTRSGTWSIVANSATAGAYGSYVLTVTVTAPVAAPTANYTMSVATGAAPLAVRFTSISTGSVDSYGWSFGDGGTSSSGNPSHIFTAAGTYTVRLTVTGPGGSNSAAYLIKVTAPVTAAPVAAFTATPRNGTAPLAVTFTNATSGDVSSYTWDFGDGGTSTSPNPSHTYVTAGTYTARLTATNVGGSSSATLSITALPTQLPDLVARRITIRDGGQGMGSDVGSPVPGQQISIVGWYLNDTDFAASGWAVKGLLDGVVVTEWGSLEGPPRAERGVYYAWTATIGRHTFEWQFDAHDQVREGSEANNSVVFSFDVLGSPILHAPVDTLVFGEVLLGSSRTLALTITNTGTAPATTLPITVTWPPFGIDRETLTVPAGGSASTSVTFTPSEAGRVTGTVGLRFGNAVFSTVLTGVGVVAQPRLVLGATELDFGPVAVGSEVYSGVVITNNGPVELAVSAVSSSDPQFVPVQASLNVAPGKNRVVSVAFSPVSPGRKLGVLALTHNAAGSPSSVSLSGTGIDATPPAAPTGLAAAPGNSQAVLSWSGNTEPDLSYYVMYRSNMDNFTPAPGDSVAQVDRPTTTCTSTGLSAGTYYFRVAAVDSTGNRSSTSAQTSVTLAPVIAVSPSFLEFGSVTVGQTESQTLTVSNTGSDTLVVSRVGLSGVDRSQFAQATAEGSPMYAIPPGSSQTLSVPFTPDSEGNKAASLIVEHNPAPTLTSTVVMLSGTGDAPPTAPTGLAAADGDAQVTIVWVANSEPDASYYVIYRSLTSSFTPTPADSVGRVNQADPKSFSQTGLTIRQTYYYRVVVVDAGGNRSPAAAEVSATPRVAGISVAPTSLSFGSVRQGTSRTLPFTVSETGTAALAVSGIGRMGTDSSMYSVSPTSFTIADGGWSQTVLVTFAPPVGSHSTTAKYAVLSLTDNAPDSLQVTLNGIATAPVVTVSPLSFGSVGVGQDRSQNLTVSNSGTDTLFATGVAVTGTDAGQFAVTPGPFTVPPGAIGTLSVAFVPTSAGAKNAVVVLTHDPAPTATSTTAPLTGSGDAPPVAPSAVTATAGDRQVTLAWTANTEPDVAYYVIYRSQTNDFAPTTADSVGRVSQVAPPSFASSDLANGVSYYFRLAAVDAGGNRSPASMQVSAILSTVGIEVSPSLLAFGNVRVGTRRSMLLAVSETGTAALVVSSVARSGVDSSLFRVSPGSFTVPDGGISQVVQVTFAPPVGSHSTAPKAALVSFVDNAPGNPQVTLSGVATAPVVAVSPVPLDFGDVAVGQKATQTLTVTNNGTDTLDISGPAVFGTDRSQFAVSPGNLTVPAGASRALTVTFTPGSAGAKSAVLTLTHNPAPSATSTSATLAGNGTTAPKPGIRVSPAVLAMAQTLVKQSSQKTVTIGNSGNAPLRVQLQVTGKDPSQFRASPANATIVGGDSLVFTVVFAPTAEGSKSAALSITHNAANKSSPLSVTLTATAVPVTAMAKLATSLDPGRVLSWGKVAQSQRPLQKSFTVRNVGKATLQVSSITITGSSLVQLVGATRFDVAPNGMQTVRVALTPQKAGKLVAKLALTSNDPTQGRVTISIEADIQAAVGKVMAGVEVEPGAARLGAAFPNPFNLSTTLEYELSEAGEVQLTVYAWSGQVVRRLVSGWHAAGRYSVAWDGRDESGQAVGSGMYLGRLETAGNQQTRRMTLVK